MIETVVESISVNLVTQNRVVILKEVDGDRQLLIWIGEFEAQSIVIELRHQESPRPLPYDLLRSAIESLGGVVENVVISDLSQDIYFARVVINQQGQTIELDSRASDAIALALRCNCPIYVDERVMDVAGVRLDDEDQADVDIDPDSITTPTGRAEAQRGGDDQLSIFRDFIDSLDLDDFGKHR
jgi:bifunctional DNase/RNase